RRARIPVGETSTPFASGAARGSSGRAAAAGAPGQARERAAVPEGAGNSTRAGARGELSAARAAARSRAGRDLVVYDGHVPGETEMHAVGTLPRAVAGRGDDLHPGDRLVRERV